MVGSTPERTRSKANPLLPQPYDSLDELLAVADLDGGAHHQPQRRPRRPGEGGDRRRQARRVREATRRRRHADGRAGRPRRRRRSRQRSVLQPALLRPQPARRGARQGRRSDRRAAPDQWPLPPGLAAPRHGLELAPRRGAGRATYAPSPTSARTGSTSCSSSAVSTSSRCSPTCTRSSPSGAGPPVKWRRSPPPGRRRRPPRSRADGERRRRRPAAALRRRRPWRVHDQPGLRGSAQPAGVGDRRRRVGPGVGVRRPDHLWIGHRGRPNEIVEKDPALLTPEGAAAAAFPGGHVEGYADTFRPCSPPCTPTSLPAHHRRSRTTPRSPTATTSWPCATPSPPRHQGAWTSIDRG